MARLQHVCPNKGCRVYALAAGSDDKGDDEQEGAAHLPREKRILPELLERRRELIMKNEHVDARSCPKYYVSKSGMHCGRSRLL